MKRPKERGITKDLELDQLQGKPGYAEADYDAPPKNQLRAHYKVEVNIRPSRGDASRVTGRIALVRSGSNSHGGSDVAVFRCPRCKNVILPEMTSSVAFVCPNCQLVDDSEKISEGSVFAFLTKQKMAELIMEYWLAVKGDADIYLKRYKHSLNDAVTALKRKDYRTWNKLRVLAKQRERVIYRMEDIMRDNLSGADMVKRFRQFLTPSMTVEELLTKITDLKHTMRVYEFLVEKLYPFLDQDLGDSETLEAEGCLVQHIPKEKIREVIGALTDTIEGLNEGLQKLNRHEVVYPEKGKRNESAPKLAAGPRPGKKGVRRAAQ